jgi:hypothetical protein
VKVSPIAANPILGAVRPDLGKQPLKDYKPRAVPRQAEAPTPIALTPPKPPVALPPPAAPKAAAPTTPGS